MSAWVSAALEPRLRRAAGDLSLQRIGAKADEGRAERVQLRYGIENYFFAEGTGGELALRWGDAQAKRVDIHAAVDDAGNSGIKAVLVNGKGRYVETLL